MRIELVEGKEAEKLFGEVSSAVYAGNKYFRGTDKSVEKLVLGGSKTYSQHANVKQFILFDGNDAVARFALINDKKLPDYVQIAYFEAIEGLGNIYKLIVPEIKKFFPLCNKVVAGLNGHLNYGAGILMNRFDEVPVFGLPYQPEYFADYFADFQIRRMFTFRINMEMYAVWANSFQQQREIPGLKLRFMDKKNIKAESAIYTYLNNKAFTRHPFWADREIEEDIELFYPFRHLLDNENLVFAEVNGEPVGFFLWYPDFNQMVSSHRDLNLIDVIKFRAGKRPDTFRFTEIGIIPEYQRSTLVFSLIQKPMEFIMKNGFKFCEGGFIFEENKASVAFAKGLFKRSLGAKPDFYREYAVFERKL